MKATNTKRKTKTTVKRGIFDETPVSLLAPGRGKTKKAYVWVYRTTNFVAQRAVFYDFCKDRSGENPRRVLVDFGATLVTDDY